MNQSKALEALSAMAHETRLDILRMLVRQGAEGMAAGQIGVQVAAPASRLSFHLAILERAGLVSSQRVARQVIYRAETRAIGAVMGFLLHDCCAANPTVRACCQNPNHDHTDHVSVR